MEPAKKELIKEIKNLFEDFEEAYVPGEWEAFSKGKPKKRILVPQWLKVAAVLLLMAAALPFAMSDFFKDHKAVETVTVKMNTVKDNNDRAASMSIKQSKTAVTDDGQQSSTDRQNISGQKEQQNPLLTANANLSGEQQINETLLPVTTDTVALKNTQTVTVMNQEGKITSSLGNVLLAEEKKVSLKQEQNTLDFLRDESKSGRISDTRKKEKTDKWNFGLEVMPTVIKSGLTFGAGISTAYRLNESFSISSGISMVKLESGGVLPQLASNSMSAPNTQGSFASQSSKTLLSVDANISAIDVPIGIVYHVSKSFYTSVGISYFNILRDKRSNTYETTSSFYKIDTDPVTGIAETYQAVKSEAIAEPADETPMKGNSYLGFFNLSVGRDQRIFKQYHIMVEPFIKIPMGKLSSEGLNLMNSGVKFRLAF